MTSASEAIGRPPEDEWHPAAPDRVLAAAALGIAFALCLPAVAGLSHMLQRVEFYAHGYLIPLVAAYLAYGKRRQISEALRQLHPPRYGALIAFGAAVFEVLMLVGDVGFAAGVGVPIVLGATAYAVGGAGLLRPLRLPLAFLVLAIPPPAFVLYELLFRLKLLVTKSAVWVLHAWGAPVFSEGNLVLVPGHTLFVADACSGITSIVTMVPIAVVIAYFLIRDNWRRALLVASVFPLALGTNILRVIVTVQLVSVIGIESAQGILHETFGLATYVLGTLALVGLARLLR